MKRLLLLSALVCGVCLMNCAVTTREHITRAYQFDTPMTVAPITADLKISDRLSRGEASGPTVHQAQLEQEAIANALGQNPPSVDQYDVLVGMNVYREQQGGKIKIIVTGYPAMYTNIRPAAEGDTRWLVVTGTGGRGNPQGER